MKRSMRCLSIFPGHSAASSLTRDQENKEPYDPRGVEGHRNHLDDHTIVGKIYV